MKKITTLLLTALLLLLSSINSQANDADYSVVNELDSLPKRLPEKKKHMKLSDKKMIRIPGYIFKEKQLTWLTVNGDLRAISPRIGKLTNLTKLDLSKNHNLFQLPRQIGNLSDLIVLNLNQDRIERFPKTVEKLNNLKNLYLIGNKLNKMPKNIEKFPNLKNLILSNNNLTEIPQEIFKLTTVRKLNLSKNQISEISPEITKLTELRFLYLNNNLITSIPDEIIKLKNLKILSLVSSPLDKQKFTEFLVEYSKHRPVYIAEYWDIRYSLCGNYLVVYVEEIYPEWKKFELI